MSAKKSPQKHRLNKYNNVCCYKCALLGDVDKAHHICPKTGMITPIHTKKICVYYAENINKAAHRK